MKEGQERRIIYRKELPAESNLNSYLTESSFADSFHFNVIDNQFDAPRIYYEVFYFLPKPFVLLMAIRNKIAPLFGLPKGGLTMSPPLNEIKAGQKAGFLDLTSVSNNEVIATASDNTMDIWISVAKISDCCFSVSTLVDLKTTSARVYMRIIKPFHKMLAGYTLKSAMRQGRL